DYYCQVWDSGTDHF
nr:immunoglobulin light chain junction region [Macaca mulatta]MOX29016.1 immunoglobulin light chain junction region [Macaca mulatta]